MTENATISVFDEETLHALRKAGFKEVEIVRDDDGHEFLVLVRQ
jgi:hypothetical protein